PLLVHRIKYDGLDVGTAKAQRAQSQEKRREIGIFNLSIKTNAMEHYYSFSLVLTNRGPKRSPTSILGIATSVRILI
ncbi:MAG: hypothetical protein QNJ36_17970, partial [Calothrix sp. MO_167.B42]|nr:hypothetical protein [Calothrix sp. MO_167.B42]